MTYYRPIIYFESGCKESGGLFIYEHVAKTILEKMVETATLEGRDFISADVRKEIFE